ncbi:MAG TPA: hypothetical protein DCM86_03795, partial [Verrucomicrobiales bacterium]|nr:hypothetical protein [Verrucomicrobiales bacterium]
MRLTTLFIALALLPAVRLPAGTGVANAPVPAEKSAADLGNRYLFVVENSSSMQKRDERLRQVVFDTIYGGAYGRMQPGDSFGVWLFSSEVDSRYPMQLWDPGARLDLGTRVNTYIKDRGYQKRASVEHLMRDLTAVVHAVRDVTVLFFTDGEEKMVGTPFDKEINGFYKELGRELEKGHEPFITALLYERGEVVAYSVARPGEPLSLPPVAPRGKGKKSGTRLPQA